MTNGPARRRTPGRTEEIITSLLLEIAGRLETNRSDQPLTAVSRIAVIQATTMSPPLARALRARAPEVTAPVTRREYAARLRTALQPDVVNAPSCCGRPMRKDGEQFVCGRCGAWSDPGSS